MKHKLLYSDTSLKVREIVKDSTGNVVVVGDNKAISFFVDDNKLVKSYEYNQPVKVVVDSKKDSTFLIIKELGAVHLLEKGVPQKALMYTVEDHDDVLLFNLGEMKVYAGYSEGWLTLVTLSENGMALSYLEVGKCDALEATGTSFLCLNGEALKVYDIESFLMSEWSEGEMEEELEADKEALIIRTVKGARTLKAFDENVAVLGNELQLVNLFDLSWDVIKVKPLSVSFDGGAVHVLEEGKVSTYTPLIEKVGELEVAEGFEVMELQRGVLFLGGEKGLVVLETPFAQKEFRFEDKSEVNKVAHSLSASESAAKDVFSLIKNIIDVADSDPYDAQNQSS